MFLSQSLSLFHSALTDNKCHTTTLYWRFGPTLSDVYCVHILLFFPSLRWGGMISTPDAVLQAVIKRALIDSGCPDHIIQELMENAHERRWPPGLSTLETRQLHRRQYENYITKRIPGKQVCILRFCLWSFIITVRMKVSSIWQGCDWRAKKRATRVFRQW